MFSSRSFLTEQIKTGKEVIHMACNSGKKSGGKCCGGKKGCGKGGKKC